MPHGREVEILKNVQHLQHHDPTPGGAVGADAVTAIVAPQRLVFLGAIALEVIQRQQAAIGRHVGRDRLGDITLVEGLDSLFGNAPQGPCHIGVLEDGAGASRGAVRVQIEPSARSRESQAIDMVDETELFLPSPKIVNVWTDLEAPLGIVDRRREQVLPCQRAVTRQRFMAGLEAARCGDRLIANVVDVVLDDEAEPVFRLRFDQVFPHFRRCLRRRPGVEVDEAMHAELRQVELHGAEAGDSRHLRVHHRLHQRAGDCRIDGVAAVPQGHRPGLDGLGLRRHDHSTRHVSPAKICVLALDTRIVPGSPGQGKAAGS